MRPGLDVHVVVGQDSVRRDEVLAEVLVLIIAPDQHHIGLELIQCLPGPFEPLDQRRPMAGRRGAPLVVCPLAAHQLRPVRRILLGCRDRGVLERTSQDAGHRSSCTPPKDGEFVGT